MGKEKLGILIADNLVCIAAENSETGEAQTIIGNGTFTQEEFRTILRRRLGRKHHPFIEIHSFEETVTIITPSLQEQIKYSDKLTRSRFLDETSYEMFDAEKVIFKS